MVNVEKKLPTSLGSNVGSSEWVDKKAKQVKMAEFGKQIKQYNQHNVVVDAQKYKSKEEQEQYKEQVWKKRFDYDKSIPKPKVQEKDRAVQEDELEKLES